jgi:hypothetical protein
MEIESTAVTGGTETSTFLNSIDKPSNIVQNVLDGSDTQDLYQRMKELEKELEFLDIQEDYIKEE